MTMFKNLTPEQFHTRFATRENACCIFRKKMEGGLPCRKCGNGNYCQGRSPFSRRCTRCKHDESATPIPRFMAAISVCRMRFYLLLYFAISLISLPCLIAEVQYPADDLLEDEKKIALC